MEGEENGRVRLRPPAGDLMKLHHCISRFFGLPLLMCTFVQVVVDFAYSLFYRMLQKIDNNLKQVKIGLESPAW